MAAREKRNATTSRGGGGGGAEATMSVDLANFPGCGEGLEQAARFCNNGGLVVRSLSQRHLLRRDGVHSPYPGEFDYVGRLGPWRSCFHSHPGTKLEKNSDGVSTYGSGVIFANKP